MITRHLPEQPATTNERATATPLTARQKVIGFGLSCGLGVYFGPAVAEVLARGPKAAVAAGILISVMGMDVIGGLLALAAAFRADPIGTFKAWWSAWWTRGSGP